MSKIKGQLEDAQLHNKSSDPTLGVDGKIWLNTTSSKAKIDIGSAVHEILTHDQTQTISGKSIDADTNTITNIKNADIKAGAAIARNKLESGSNSHVVINDGSGVLSSEAQLAKSRGGTGADNSSVTFPSSGTIATIAGTQVITNKDIDGGTASDSIRITIPKNTATNNAALTRKEATVLYATDTGKLYLDNGSTLSPLATEALVVASASFTTGDVKLTLKTSADSGWVMCNDGTIGSASSGATTRASADTSDLYALLWNNVTDTYAPVTGGRGASAAADFAANKPLALTKMLGRSLGIAGAGSGLTSRALGLITGAETHTLSSAEMPSHTHTQDAHTHTQNSHTHSIINGYSGATQAPSAAVVAQSTPVNATNTVTATPTYSASNAVGSQWLQSTTPTNQNTTATNQNTGGGGSHNNMQPTSFLNAMIKL